MYETIYHKIVMKYGRKIINSKNFIKQKDFIQHGTTTVYEHCINVAILSVKIALEKNIKVDMRSLVRGALLHDYFGYDWHIPDKSHRLHGFTHPFVAYNNAKRDFKINKKEKDIITKHMFPLTPFLPMCKESWIVTSADKLVSTKETCEILIRKLKKV